MPVYLPTAIVANASTLVTLGHAGEIMGWFYPSKDHAQHVYQCLPAVYLGHSGQGSLHWTYENHWHCYQYYDGDCNICVTELTSEALALRLKISDVMAEDGAILLRRIVLQNIGGESRSLAFFCYGDWNMSGIRTGNALRFDHAKRLLVQSHREAALAIGGDAVETFQCGKAGLQWGSNALKDLDDGALCGQDLEIGDVNWAWGFSQYLHSGESTSRTVVFALAPDENAAMSAVQTAIARGFDKYSQERRALGEKTLEPGLKKLRSLGTAELPLDLDLAFKRSLLCLPLLCGNEGVAVAAPEFDPEFISCGGYGYHWPRDGGEYVSGLLDAGYPEYSTKFFDWCARHQDESGLWHQRYFLNGAPGPNWCLPPDMLQIDQVGAVLWALGKWMKTQKKRKLPPKYETMTRRAADYLLSRLNDKGVHGNAFDTWETFIGSFTYSNAAIYAALQTAAQTLGDEKYREGAVRVKNGVLKHFVRECEYSYLARGFDGGGHPDGTVDSASLGAIEPFELLDLNDARDLEIAEGTLRAVTEKLDVDWEGGRAIRRFEGDAYVGGVPACVNTLWMARCCLKVAARLRELNRHDDAKNLTQRAQTYLQTVLRRGTPTGLLPELMQGPTGQRYWAAPHGWAMASFVSGVLMLARELNKDA